MKASGGLASRGPAYLAAALALLGGACSGGGGDSGPVTTSTLTVVASGDGLVTSSPAGIVCGHGGPCSMVVNDGTAVTLTATGDAGFRFAGWTGACSGAAPCLVTVRDDVSATATFVPLRLLTVTVNGAGTVTTTPAGLSCSAGICAASFDAGTAVTLTASPAATWTFSGWTGACTGTGGCSVTLATSAAAVATFAPTSGTAVTFEGRITYDFVPATYDPATRGGTLDFGGAEERPVRGAVVRVVNGATILATGATNDAGDYEISFEPGGAAAVSLVVLARTFVPELQVEDNTDQNAVWAVALPTTPTSGTRHLRATHGWNGAAYTGPRAAAPFAILDSMYTAARRFLDLPRAVRFPALKVNWSPDNTTEFGNKATGLIGTSHYSPLEGEIYILGKEGVDTDEFDSHVIVHEWAHYFEDNLSRADSPGGPHGPGDVLDPRLAFGEGYGNALAAMLLPESIYADTLWFDSSIEAFGFDAESVPSPTDDGAPAPYATLNPGPFSEMSVLRVLYDLYDGANEAHDAVALGLGPIYDTLVGPQRSTDSFTTIASFISGLKAQPGVGAAGVTAIDAVLANRSIGPITDPWGAGDGNLSAMFPNAAPLPFSGGVKLDGGFVGQGSFGEANKWQSKQYWVVTGTGRNVTATATSTSSVILEAYRAGLRVDVAGSPAATVQFPTVNGWKYILVVTGLETDPVSYDVGLSVASP